MEILLVVLAFIFLVVGLLGSIVPVLPGPPLSYIGLLVLHWSGRGDFSIVFLMVWAGITVAVTVMDNILPAWMTKKFGGSRIAVIGSVAGLIAGMFLFAPWGLIVGPFLGAFAGELINNSITSKRSQKNVQSNDLDGHTEMANVNVSGNTKALKAALGAFLAFIVGTGAKLIIGSMMIYYAVKAVF